MRQLILYSSSITSSKAETQNIKSKKTNKAGLLRSKQRAPLKTRCDEQEKKEQEQDPEKKTLKAKNFGITESYWNRVRDVEWQGVSKCSTFEHTY